MHSCATSFAEMVNVYRKELAFVDWARESICRGEEEVTGGGKIVGAQGRGDPGLLGDSAVCDARRAIASNHREGGVDDLGPTLRAPSPTPINLPAFVGHVTVLSLPG